MANKVLVSSKSNILTRVEETPKEVFLDINMVSDPTAFQKYVPQLPQDYLAYVRTEKDTSSDLSGYIGEETNLPEDFRRKFMVQYAEKNDNDEKYKKYINRGKWKINRLVNVNAIRNSLHNIFTWTPGERILNPEFGSSLRQTLYEGITTSNIEKVGAEIQYSISKWEPRINIIEIQNITSADDTENNTVHLRIVYTIPSLTDEQFAYEYYQDIATR